MHSLELPTFEDKRGLLAVWDRNVPFEVRRVFWIYGVPKGQSRANHGHRECEQAIFAVSGSFMVNDYFLSLPASGVYVPVGTVIKLHEFSPDAVCLVLCSQHYDKEEVYEPSPPS